ncbi:hypothetical protein Vretifemale_8103 [Volvox reticuliferus]|uniref:histidine kinase n=1 Tax=Volvox reticuliferus TaxID=1737510 RepID=A0A8J4CHD8_9CHLO|nr:hypothetical protein Vretifemale_8103 [Volvox reticuliferus]
MGGLLGLVRGFGGGGLAWLLVRLSGAANGSGISNGSSSTHGSPGSNGSSGSRLASRSSGVAAQRSILGSGGFGGAGSSGLGSSGPTPGTGLPQPRLPAPMEALVCATVGGKLLQAIAAAVVGAVAPGRGLSLLHGDPAALPMLIWSLSTAITLLGLPLAIGMYYGMVRYAASMLVAGRSTLRRVSSLGMVVGMGPAAFSGGGAGHGSEDGLLGSQGLRSSQGSLGLGLSALRRAAAYGGDSDSDSGLPALPNRLMEIGDLYRITESSGHSISYSTSGDEGWRNDLALSQLLYMARTTFRRSSSDEARPAEGASGTMPAGAGGSPMTATNQPSRRSSSTPTPPQTANAAVQTEHRVSFGSWRCELGVQCDIGPATVIKEVPVEVRVEVPMSSAAISADGGPLMALIQALREHSSDIAHDMKNPLNGVLALSQNVLQGTFGELPTTAADQLGVVRACAYHLLNMINQLRDCMRMLHGGEPDGNRGRVQLCNAIEEVLKRMSPMVGSRLTIRAEHDPSLIVYADDSRLYQSVHTVLANAFKYTRKGGVTIETSTSSDKSAVTLRVTDTGTGFTPEQLDKFNSPLTGSPAEQLGLGLTMVKRTMAYFGGTLRLGNRTSGGSGGWVELTFRAKEEVPPLGAGLPPPLLLQSAAPAAPPQEATVMVQQQSPFSAAAAAATPAAVTAATHQAATATAAPAAREPQKKMRKSIIGGADRAGMEERLAAANSSNDRGGSRGPSSSSAAAGAGASARGGGGGPCSTPLTGGINDDALTGKGDEPVRVLIVDDDPVNLTILEDLLRAEGYDVLTAASGTEALEAYLTSDPQPKLVLLDVTLPDLSGHEVCLKMRSLTPGVPPPIIMISGKASTKDVIKGLQAGACDYITKPFQPQEVMARVETQLRMFMGEVAQLQEAAERNMALLRQILPPHILASLRGGTRVLVEKFSDAVVLCADVVGFSALAAAADTADCILTLNRLFSTFDALTDKMGVHKMDCHTDSYVAALGHMPQDRHLSNVMQVKLILDLAREMLAAVDSLPYPDTLGKMQIRIGVHVGAVFGGVIGVKYPRYSLFGTTLRLAQGLQATALPNTIHVTEVVHNRVRAAGGEKFMPYTTSQVQSLGIIRTYLVGTGPDGSMSPGMLDYSHLDSSVVMEYLRSATAAAHGMTILNCLLGASGSTSGGGAVTAAVAGGGQGLGLGFSAGQMVARHALVPPTSATSTAVAPPPLLPQTSPAGVVPVPSISMAPTPEASAVRGGGIPGGGGGSAAYKIIPVISNRHLSTSGAGDMAGSVGSTVGGVMASSGSHFAGPSRSRESDASGYAITLAQVPHVALDPSGNDIDSTLAAIASSDVGSNAMTMELSNAAANIAAQTASSATGSSNSASAAGLVTAGGATSGAASVAAHGFGSTTAISVSGVSCSVPNNGRECASGGTAASIALGGRRLTNDASLVQDLSPGPLEAGLSGLTRMQRLHAGSQQQSPGSGAASPRPGGGPSSRGGSCGPSRNTSFRIAGAGGGGGGGGGASPLAATLMHQHLMTALQQQQQQKQQENARGILRVVGPHVPVAGDSRMQSTEGSVVFAPEDGVTNSPQSTSEPLLKFQLPEGNAGVGTGGGAIGSTTARIIASASMRRIHVPPKAASIGSIPGGVVSVGAGVGVGIGHAAASSVAGSVSAGGISTAGSLGSPPVMLSPTVIATPVHAGGVATAATAAVPSLSSPYAGLSSETRARLARLRTASQPDLYDAAVGPFAGSAVGGTGRAVNQTVVAVDAITSMTPISVDIAYGGAPSSAEYGIGSSIRHAASGPSPTVTQLTTPVRFSPESSVGGTGGAGCSASSQQASRRATAQRPSTVSELLESLGLGHYSRSITGAVSGGLNELASLDDSGLRKVGLISSRSRQLVREELMRWGYK